MNTLLRPCILHIDNVSFAYPDQPPLASGWSASIGQGVTQLHGDTGSGKSTLLRVMGGAQPAHGRLTIAGTFLDKDPDAYRRNVFFVDPTSDRFDQVGVRECMASLREGDAHFSDATWHRLVEAFGLAPHVDKPMYMLSTGSRRKVWLAAAMASGRALTLLDEPTGGLDAGSIRALWRALNDVAAQPGRAVVVASGERLDGVPLVDCIELPLSSAQV